MLRGGLPSRRAFPGAPQWAQRRGVSRGAPTAPSAEQKQQQQRRQKLLGAGALGGDVGVGASGGLPRGPRWRRPFRQARTTTRAPFRPQGGAPQTHGSAAPANTHHGAEPPQTGGKGNPAGPGRQNRRRRARPRPRGWSSNLTRRGAPAVFFVFRHFAMVCCQGLMFPPILLKRLL